MAQGQPRPDLTICGGFEKVIIPGFRKDTVKKGNYMADHILNIREVRRAGTCSINAQCIREMSLSNDPYSVELVLDPDTRSVADARCSCQAGVTGMCKHTAALVLAVNTERSSGCTDDTQKWHKPSQKLQELYPKGETVQQMVQGKKAERRNFLVDRDTLDNLALLMEKHKLQNSSIFKSITADLSLAQVEINNTKKGTHNSNNMSWSFFFFRELHRRRRLLSTGAFRQWSSFRLQRSTLRMQVRIPWMSTR